MNQTYLIPDIKTKLKDMILQAFAEGKCWWKMKYCVTPPQEFLEELDNIIDFMLKSDAFVNAVELIDIYGLDLSSYNIKASDIEVILREEGEIMATYICSSPGFNIYTYDLSPYYMEEVRQKSIPAVPYKDAGCFSLTPDLSLTTNDLSVTYTYLKTPTEVDKLSIIRSKNFKDQTLRATMAQFIQNQKYNYLLINYASYEPEDIAPDVERGCPWSIHTLRGIRIYKIPRYDFSKELIYISSFKRLYDLDCCYEFLYFFIGLELSPDNYLELYATQECLDRLFFNKDGLFTDDPDWEFDIDPSFYWRGYRERLAFYKGCLGSTKNNLIFSDPKKISEDSRQTAQAIIAWWE
jgi:hypothetical protein